MNLNFTHRFNRPYFIKSNDILYQEKLLKYALGHNRDNLPSRFVITGIIIWNNTKNQYHNTGGTTRSTIDGDIQYWVNDRHVTKFEAML